MSAAATRQLRGAKPKRSYVEAVNSDSEPEDDNKEDEAFAEPTVDSDDSDDSDEEYVASDDEGEEKEEEGEEEGEEGDLDSFDEEDEADDDGLSHQLTDEQREAVAAAERRALVALEMDVSFDELRKGVRLAARVTRKYGANLRAAYHAIFPSDHLSTQDTARVLTFAHMLANQVELPMDVVRSALVPLSELRGGFLAKLLCEPRAPFEICLMAQMADALHDFRANGSEMQQNLLQLFVSRGLGEDAAIAMANQHNTESELESTNSNGRRAVEMLNSLPELQRFQTVVDCVRKLSESSAVVSAVASASSDRSRICRRLFDDLRLKGAPAIARTRGAALVSVSIAIDPQSRFATQHLKNAHGEESAIDKKPYERLPYVLAENPFQASRRNSAYDAVITHRAQSFCPEPTPESVYDTFCKIVTKSANKPRMEAFLNEVSRDLPSNMFNLPSELVYIAVRYNGVVHKIGKLKKRNRTIAKAIPTAEPPSIWLCYDGLMNDHNELRSLLCPPFRAFETGTVEFVLLFTDTFPNSTLDLHEPRLRARRQAEKHYVQVKTAKKMAETARGTRGAKSRKRFHIDEQDLKAIQEAAYRKSLKIPPTNFVLTYPRSEYPTWYNESGLRPEVSERAAGVRKAEAEAEAERRLMPGQAGALEAERSFASAATNA